ncbi:hypothetical protein GGR50DRAFT_701151 [Xylaria sp. CBS 124048]|nr:hypothetical protein GGR50DRAFT_701151 [Xylaria sp. CBS 124048]
MDNFFSGQFSEEDSQLRHSQQRPQRRQRQQHEQQQQHQHQHQQQTFQYGAVSGVPSTNPDTTMAGTEPFDEMVQNNSDELRCHGLPPHQQFSSHMGPAPVLGFNNNDAIYSDYRLESMSTSSTGHLNAGYPSVHSDISMPEATTAFTAQPMITDNYSNISPEVMGNMMALSNMNVGQMNMGQMVTSPSMTIFPAASSPNTFSSVDGLPPDYSMSIQSENAIDCDPRRTGAALPSNSNTSMMNLPSQYPASSQASSPQGVIGMDDINSYRSDLSPRSSAPVPTETLASSTPDYQTPQINNLGMALEESSPPPQPDDTPVIGPQPPIQQTVYSKSGFDMLGALWRVATRKNPQVNLGAVDMSCAFVVCDVTQNDCPIIYVSDNFQNLTGYSRHDIVGQNCRFLQAPDGKVDAGTKREFVDNDAVYNLKVKIAENKEVQQSLINYRKGGKPFLNLLTMIPIPWNSHDDYRYIIGFQIDLVECPDAITQGQGPLSVNYKKGENIGQYIWTPPPSTGRWGAESGQTLGMDDVSTLLQKYNPRGDVSDWHKQSWDKMLLENADDVVHVLSLKGLFLYLSPSCKQVLEYDTSELVGTSISSICHPSDIVPLTRELKDTTSGNPVNVVFRIRRKQGGYTWFESHGSLFVEQGKGRKCIILIGRKRPVFVLSRREVDLKGGIGDGELWTKLSTSGMFLFVSATIRSLLDLQPEDLVGTSIQELMRKESRPEFGRCIEKARKGQTVSCKHEVQNRRGQVLQAQTTLYPGDVCGGQKPTFILAQTKLLKASSRASGTNQHLGETVTTGYFTSLQGEENQAGSVSMDAEYQAEADDNIFDELKTTRCTSWQYELRQMEKVNRVLAEELQGLLANKKKRKRRKGVGNVIRDCANCHTRNTPEWRRGPSGQRDLCNSCGLRWAKQTGRASPRTSSRGGGDTGSRKSASSHNGSPVHQGISLSELHEQPSELHLSLSSSNTTTPTNTGNEMTIIQEERPVS